MAVNQFSVESHLYRPTHGLNMNSGQPQIRLIGYLNCQMRQLFFNRKVSQCGWVVVVVGVDMISLLIFSFKMQDYTKKFKNKKKRFYKFFTFHLTYHSSDNLYKYMNEDQNKSKIIQKFSRTLSSSRGGQRERERERETYLLSEIHNRNSSLNTVTL